MTERLRPSRGPGKPAQAGLVEHWGGPRAQSYVRLCLATYGDLCWLCGRRGADSADHIVPVSQGGAVYDLDNLGPSHRRCNYARGARSADLFELLEDGSAWFTRA